MAIQIDAEFSQLIPPLSEDEYRQLEANMLRDGCREPLVTWGGILVDGHNRHRICEAHGIGYQTLEMPFADREAVADWIDANQLGRRNLGADQMSLLRGRRYNRTKQQGARTDKTSAHFEQKLTTAEKLAAEYGVSRETIKRDGQYAAAVEQLREAAPDVERRIVAADNPPPKAAVVKAAALIESEPERAREILEGKKTVAEVGREIRRAAQKQKEVAAHDALPASALWSLTDAQDVVACDALITDPPYGILDEAWEPDDLRPFTEGWLRRWNDCGADVILSFWSQRYLFAGREWFDAALTNYTFQQVLVWHYRNNVSPQSRKGFKQTWEPVFFYRRKDSDTPICVSGIEWGDDLHDLDCHVAAVPQSNFTGTEMKQHPAQKPVGVFRWLVNAVTSPGALVCDPFAGSGASGIAASMLGRRWHGIEINAEYAQTARERLALYGR